jgi:hypothetical protein
LPYWLGYKLSRQTSNIFLGSFSNHEEAKERYDYLKNTEYPGEIVTPPFFADTEEEAREKVKEFIPD